LFISKREYVIIDTALKLINEKEAIYTDLLQALEKVNNTLKPLIKANPCSPELMYIINKAIEKATK
jgi:hypothetical protein